MAGCAVDIEPLLTLFQNRHRHREGKHVSLFAITIRALHQAGIEVAVVMQAPSRNGILNRRTRRAMVGKHLRTPLRNHLRLVMHILPAPRYKHRTRRQQNNTAGAPSFPRLLRKGWDSKSSLSEGLKHQYSTSTTETGSKLVRYALVSTASNFGSSASRHRKNLSDVAPSRKFGALNSG